jgi:predicted O-linked N-acetylglucosamine transferase (SPINDLY family)/SAM-dependent methyltransferase
VIKVLKNWQEIGEATLSLQRKRLPIHTDVRKNWDQLLVYDTIASLDRNAYIIDLGCSPYCTLNFMAALGFKNLYGIDLDIEDNKIENAPYHLTRGDITNTSFQSDFFDFALSISVVEHGVDLKAFFKEASRILKDNSLLFLTTDYWEEARSIDASIKPLGLPWKVFDESDIQELIFSAQDYGFVIEEDRNIPSCLDKPIFWQGVEYTFIGLLFRKKALPQNNIDGEFNEDISTSQKTTGLANIQKNAELVGAEAATDLFRRVIFAVDRYHQNSFEQSVLTDIRINRKQVADFWLNLAEDELESAYRGDIGKAHRTILNSGIKNEPLTDTEQKFVDELSAHIYRSIGFSKVIPYLLAAMLYCRAAQLPLQNDISCITDWLLNDYLTFMFESPRLFQEIGEAESYYQYVKRWVDYIHENIFSNQNSELWQKIALFFTKNASFVPLYFNTNNLQDICKKRADILELVLKNQGHQIDYDFPKRLPDQKKIRLGILAAHFQPQTETFATLPVYKHLNRDLFDIILYTLQAGDHRLERYCWGHADTVLVLPQDLQSQVQTIRDGNLDFLLIATNVTAWTNPVALLALHRLARIQIANVCSCITTGMRHVDYYISGKLSEPKNDAQQHYTETLLTLEGPAHCYDFATEEKLVATKIFDRESLGIDKNAIVYISGANFHKITPEVEVMWTKIVARTPNSKLILYPFNPNWSSNYAATAFQKRLFATFAKYGLSQEQVIILDYVPNIADVKERLKLGDIYLDSYPFAGVTSLLDPLELGLPTVVMEGSTFRAMFGAALLKELQLNELIADNEESYIKLAIALGTNSELRKKTSDEIKQRMRGKPKFLDSKAYSVQIENLLQELLRTYQLNSLSNDLKLREINFIIFPDWSKPEESLSQDLASVIRAIATHSDRSYLTLLIDSSNFSDEEANLLISGVAMNLLMEEDLDVTEGAEISLIDNLSEIQWEALLPHLHARIILENENQQLITNKEIQTLPSYDLDSFSNTQPGQFFFT